MLKNVEKENNFASRKCRLAYAGNTSKYALAAIYAKGYKVFIYPASDQEKSFDYWAIKDGRDFIAHEPEILLGLIAIWEQFGDDWLTYRVPSYKDKLLSRAFPEDEYQSLDDETFAEFVADLKIIFREIDEPKKEFLAFGGEIYQGNVPEGAKHDH